MKKRNSSPDWSTAGQRIAWLLQDQWQGNRSAMARATDCSHTIINKVVTFQQEPGRRLLAKVVASTNVDAKWLLTGSGSPFPTAIPFAERALPGPPNDNQELLSDAPKDYDPALNILYAPSRYWLRVQRGDAITKDEVQRIKAGDLLLIETDHRRFPSAWHQQLGVVHGTAADGRLALAELSSSGDQEAECLEARLFSGRKMVRVTTVIEYPEGTRAHIEEREMVEVPFRGKKLRRLKEAKRAEEEGRTIKPENVVAVCLLIVRVP